MRKPFFCPQNPSHRTQRIHITSSVTRDGVRVIIVNCLSFNSCQTIPLRRKKERKKKKMRIRQYGPKKTSLIRCLLLYDFLSGRPETSAEQAICQSFWQATENESFNCLTETTAHYKSFHLKVKYNCKCAKRRFFSVKTKITIRIAGMWPCSLLKTGHCVRLEPAPIFLSAKGQEACQLRWSGAELIVYMQGYLLLYLSKETSRFLLGKTCGILFVDKITIQVLHRLRSKINTG